MLEPLELGLQMMLYPGDAGNLHVSSARAASAHKRGATIPSSQWSFLMIFFFFFWENMEQFENLSMVDILPDPGRQAFFEVFQSLSNLTYRTPGAYGVNNSLWRI